MQRINTPLDGCFILKPSIFSDHRGYFYESYNRKDFNRIAEFDAVFVQDNQALSNYGTVRGLHFQKGEWAQAKLVRVIQGKVLDVAVDLRPGSATYGRHVSVELSGENHLQLFVPRGFAHGYSVLEDKTLFSYKCDNYYHKEAEGGIIYNDTTLGIDWKIPADRMQISEKDLRLGMFIP